MSILQVRHKAACTRIEPYNIMPLIIWFSAFFLLIGLARIVHGANVSGVSASPNPFTPPATTTISYSLTNPAILWLRIYDNSSVLKRNLVTPGSFTTTNKTAGANSSVWDGKDDSAVTLPNGTYPYRIDNVYFSTHYTGVGSNPQDVAVDPANTQIIWQLNKTSPYVYRSTNGGTSWSSVSGTGADAKAYGIAIDSTGNKIYIANNGQSNLKVSTNGGTSWGTSGTFPGSVTTVFDVASDSTGNILYVQNYSGNNVYKSTNGGTNWSTCTATGLALGTTASGIATDSTGNTVIVTDSGNNRLFKSTDGCATFSQITAITAGTAAGQVFYPYQVSIQSDGSFWVSEMNNHRIQLFNSSGNSLMIVGGTSLGTGNYQFDSGAKYFGIGLATISSQPFIFIADYNNTRVKKLGYDNWTSTTSLQIGGASDTTAPAAVSNLSAPSSTATSVTLNWTAPGDDNTTGTATTYDVRFSTTNIANDTDFNNATQATGEPAPSIAGSAESFTISTGLSCGTTYYFAMKTSDEAPNTSGLSNVVSKATVACPSGGTGMVAYGDNTTGTPKTRVWDGTDFGAEGSAQNNTSNSIRYTVLKEAPTKSEYMLGNVHSNGLFYVQRYNGTTWSFEGTFSNTNIGNGAYRYFDIAYENTSGKAIVAYEYSTSNDRRIYYNTWNGTAWSANTILDYSGLASSSNGVVYWVKLIPKANSDQMLLVFADSANGVYAYVWNGTSFANGKTITINRTASVTATEVIAAAWEGTSGDAMVLFGNNNNGLSYATFTNSTSTWSSDATAYTFNSGRPADYIAAAGDPNSDYIGVITVDQQPRLETHVWTGSSWAAGFPTPVNFSSITATAPMPISVAWQKTGGKALFAWTDSSVNRVDYVTYTVGTGWSSANLGSPSQTTTTWANRPINMVQLKADPTSGSTKIMLTGISANNDIKSILWDNGTWTQPTTYNYEASVSSNAYQAAMFAWTFTTSDTTPPANVTGFTVSNPGTGNRLNLTWTNPGDADFTGVKIVRNSGATAPADCSSGTLVYEGSGTSYNDPGLTDNQQYSYRICSYDGAPNYSSGVTGSGTPNDTTAPGNVTNVTAIPGNTQVVLSWTNPMDVDLAGTRIAWKTTGSPANCSDGTLINLGVVTSYTHAGLTNGITHYYRVCARDEVPNYASGVTASATPFLDSTPPGNVTGFTVTDPGAGNQLNLLWTNPGDADFAGVEIVRATGATAPANCSSGTTVYTGAGTGYSDTGLTDGTQYSYRICSYDNSNNYASGVTGSATPSDTTAPGNVTGLIATAGNTQVALSWSNPGSADLAGTRIAWKTTGSPANCSDGTLINLGVVTSYTHTGLTNGITYYYRVCARDEVPNYASGATVSATPGSDTTAPSAVSNLAASPIYTRGVNLTWTAPGDDGTTGTASVYDIRFTDALDYPANMTNTLLNTNWATITQAANEPAPQAANSSESFTVASDTGSTYLTPNTLYYFGLKTTDDFGNVSGISNAAPAHTAMKYGYNMISLPYDKATGGANTISSMLGDDVPYVYMFKWDSYGADVGGMFNGGWIQVDVSSASSIVNNMSNGTGYYLYAYAMNSSILDEKNSGGTGLATENTNAWVRVDLVVGRNLVGNPYLKNVNFSNIKICQNATGFSSATGCTGGTTVSYSQAVTNGWFDGSIAYYANSTTYMYETCNNISCTAKLRPWWGQWVYRLDSANTYIMAIPKP